MKRPKSETRTGLPVTEVVLTKIQFKELRQNKIIWIKIHKSWVKIIPYRNPVDIKVLRLTREIERLKQEVRKQTRRTR